MASDFGDEAGQELYDWMIRIGQDAGGKAMSDAAGNFGSVDMEALNDLVNSLTGITTSLNDAVSGIQEFLNSFAE